MDTFLEIMLYSVIVLGVLSALGAAFVFLGMWLGVTDADGHAH